ncbi:hypothetical protein BJY16_005775 [Actinoplanes octamycinicus]|uniref:Uncharacterized protein n=1 Tax=Actinoplanes octamycinicus TaxID=135948 RepID=A0A7W7H1M0_9ACTN|nr:hypothetical protein [Actinoplanes octamycinicus]MBB4742316.1 hypothetical protein [Actinoplanes octamycinicus]GIE59840.1 hypothetical protein Aoc01nite_52420 [Actinoplanes octamycinicus]
MGTTRPERELPLARTRYVAAARRFVRAFAGVLARGVPIDPGPPGHPRDWTRADVAALQELHTALGEMLTARRGWDTSRRRG